MRLKHIPWGSSILMLATLVCQTFGGEHELARQLAQEGDHAPAAIEFRRLALKNSEPSDRGGYYWLAGHEYMQAGDFARSNEMLDRAESEDSELVMAGSLVRGENALALRKPDEAGFYLETLLFREGLPAQYAARRLAAINMRAGDIAAAERLLIENNPDHLDGINAIADYRAGDDKSPTLGGLLGLVPGLGHAYSGEYANAMRCLILNALFIYGMIDTAENDNWGAFTVITFFEITWYSGSIYGGIDAAHRYNRNRLDASVAGIEDGYGYSPDWQAIPTIKLEFSF